MMQKSSAGQVHCLRLAGRMFPRMVGCGTTDAVRSGVFGCAGVMSDQARDLDLFRSLARDIKFNADGTWTFLLIANEMVR